MFKCKSFSVLLIIISLLANKQYFFLHFGDCQKWLIIYYYNLQIGRSRCYQARLQKGRIPLRLVSKGILSSSLSHKTPSTFSRGTPEVPLRKLHKGRSTQLEKINRKIKKMVAFCRYSLIPVIYRGTSGYTTWEPDPTHAQSAEKHLLRHRG